MSDTKEKHPPTKLKSFLHQLFGKSSPHRGIMRVALAGCLLLLLASGVALFVALEKRSQEEECLRLTGCLAEIDGVQAALLDAGNCRNGFLLTGQKSYADGFDKQEQLVSAHLSRLRELLGTQVKDLERKARIAQSFDEWCRTIAHPGMDAVKSGKIQPGPAALVPPLPTPSFASIRDSVASFRADLQAAYSAKLEGFPAGVPLQQALLVASDARVKLSVLENAGWNLFAANDKASLDLFNSTALSFLASQGQLSSLLAGFPARAESMTALAAGIRTWQQQAATQSAAVRSQNMDGFRQGMDGVTTDLSVAYEKATSRAGLICLVSGAGVALLCLVAIAALVVILKLCMESGRKQEVVTQVADNQTKSVIAAALDGIITLDGQGSIQLINPAAEKLFGVKSVDVVGKSITKLIPQRLLLQDMARIGSGTLTATGQRDGYYPFPIEISLSEMQAGGHRHFVAVIRDVTTRKHAEEVLQHVGLGISTVTGKDFLRTLIKQLSQAMQSDLAFVVELNREGVNKPCTVSIAESGQIRAIQKFNLEDSVFQEVLRKGFLAKPSGVAREYPGDRLIYELGVEALIAMPLLDHSGKQVGIMGVMHRRPMDSADTTEATLQIFSARAGAEIERQRFADDLAAEKERLAITLRAIADGFIATDTQGRILMLNNAAERMTGWTNEKAVGQLLIEVFRVINERTKNVAQNVIQRIVETGTVGSTAGNLILASTDGTQRIIDANAAPIRDRTNRKTGVVLVFRDITEKQQLEEEHRKAEKLESLGIAAGGIAHDFNNLLTAILGNISLVTMELDPDDSAVTRLNTAKKASLRAQELAQQLLTFAKGGAPVKKTSPVVKLIEDAARLCIRSQNIRLETSLPDSLDPCDIDPGQISQVITNITVNAEHAMPNGGTIRITGENVFLDDEAAESLMGRPGRYVKISIRDHGIGIPEEYLKKIFDPYFTTKPQASGLGLATAYSIVKNHKGFIAVNSEPGEGSIFSVYLPASEKDLSIEKPVIPAAAYKPGAVPPEIHGRVLVIDDEDFICTLVSNSLTPLGYDVTECTDASEGIKLYQEAYNEGRRFDLVISDLTMPGRMSGQEAVKILLQFDPGVKVIASSGYATDPVMSRHREYGFCASLAKPYEVAALVDVVHEVINAPAEQQVYHELAQSGME
jgi:PAS domain S-box-containing protein